MAHVEVTTSTANKAIEGAGQKFLGAMSDSTLWAAVRIQETQWKWTFWYSKDEGQSWTRGGDFVNDVATTQFSMFIDIDDYVHVVYINTDSSLTYYRRGTPNAGKTSLTWSSATQVSAAAETNPGRPDIVAHREGTGWKAHIVRGNEGAGSLRRVSYGRVDITSGGTISVDVSGTVISSSAGSTEPTPSIDFHHTGNAKTVKDAAPHLFVAYVLQTSVRWVKGAYSAGTWSWGTERTIRAETPRTKGGDGHALLTSFFDGTQAVITWIDSADGNPSVSERDVADTTTTSRDPGLNIGGSGISATYDASGDIYLLGQEASPSFTVKSLKYDRSADSWGSAVTEDAPGSATDDTLHARRGYDDAIGGAIDILAMAGSVSPYTVNFERIESFNAAPNPPTLVSPTNGSTQDLDGGFTFDWTFSDPDVGDTQSAWAFRRKIGGGAYEYWNASTTAWQSTEVYNSGSADQYAFGASTWTSDGTTYNWSVRAKDDSGKIGAYASDFTVTGSSPPSAVVDAPTGSVTDTNQPVVEWTYSDPEGDVQDAYRAKVFSSDQYGAGGFDPETSTATWDSGDTLSSAEQRQVGVSLSNGVTYRAYVKVRQTGGLWSAWSFSTFTTAIDEAAIPALTATADDANNRVTLAVQGRSNMLSANQASLETDTSGWAADVNCSIARSIAQSLKGDASLELTATAAADMSARTPTGVGGVPALPGKQYTALVSFRAAATVRQVRIRVRWYDSGGALLSTSDGAYVSDSTSGWTQATLTVNAPAGSAFASAVVEVQAAAASEVHYVDAISLAPGAGTAWSRGGAAASHAFRIEFSDDSGTTWATVRNASGVAHDSAANQQATVDDYEAPPNTERQYRARTVVTV